MLDKTLNPWYNITIEMDKVIQIDYGSRFLKAACLESSERPVKNNSLDHVLIKP